MKKFSYLIFLLSQLLTAAWAQEAFVVKNIKVEGLLYMSPTAVENYLPIKRGEVLRPEKTAAVIRALNQTGMFNQISLSREGNTLVVHATERAVIGQLKISGNSIIPTDKLTEVMRSLDVAEGRIYNPVTLEKIKQSLLNQYYQLGRYNARVDVDVTPLSRNRVLVKITISEGLVAKIRRINIIGNHAFDEDTLTKQMDITTSGLFTLITQKDRYSEAKLEENLEKLRNYYMDRGYLRFTVKSAQAEVTPDHKAVYINIVVDEGQPYTIKNFDVRGNLILPREEIVKLINIRPGETFSRQKIIDSEKAITKRLGDQGYMYATINLHPEIDDATHQVFLIFTVTPGKRTYVRNVTFSENKSTNDVVLRREVQQLEAAPASPAKLDESKRRLSLLPFIKDVEMTVNPVPGIDDQVDVNYKVKEEGSAQATFKVGYSQQQHTILGAGFNQKNFFGTGNTLGVNLSHSKFEQFYGIDYTNPYYTEDGISRTFSLSLMRVNPSGAGLRTGYTTNEYDFGVLYGIPIGQEQRVINRLQVGVSYENTLVNLTNSLANSSNQIRTFVLNNGRHFQELDFRLGYSRDSRDRAIFPTSGALQTLFFDGYAPVTRDSLAFYTINYHGRWYYPLTSDFIISSRANFGYGSSFGNARNYPFFKNYYAGGIDSVRGFTDFSLGPLDSFENPYGGNMLVDASIGIIFPNFISDNLRTTFFVDAGNVYSTFSNRAFGCSFNGLGGKTCSTNSGPIRYSFGIEADILTPFGPIQLSVARGLPRRHDELSAIQFALGANF